MDKGNAFNATKNNRTTELMGPLKAGSASVVFYVVNKNRRYVKTIDDWLDQFRIMAK